MLMMVLRREWIALIRGNFIPTGFTTIDSGICTIVTGAVQSVVGLMLRLIQIVCILVLSHFFTSL
ncbi:hypothetical protein JF55_13945 [Pseudomonas sp. 1-7]|nr:hypothetical protein JF55_13945 [Pseudomonas sp. 1-7]